VVLTFDRCGAFAADQDAASTAVGWATSFDSAAAARRAALAACAARGGASCMARVWGCNRPVVEEALPLTRAARRRVQQGLQAEGFSPGVADGIFGPRTRAAIRDWQSARGAPTTGYLDGPEADALRSAGASGPRDVTVRSPGTEAPALGAQVSGGAEAGGQSADPASRNRPRETCAGQAAGAACWMETQQPGCYAWNPNLQAGETLTWTGECAAGFAQGRGTLVWVWDGNRSTSTGRLVDGKGDGHWVIRTASGNVEEGPMVDGEENGHWVIRHANGTVSEGPAVDGKRSGHWVIRYATGTVSEGLYVDGERNGHWVIRDADGNVGEGSYAGGEQNGHWTYRYASGNVEEGSLVNGKRNGRWLRQNGSDDVAEHFYGQLVNRRPEAPRSAELDSRPARASGYCGLSVDTATMITGSWGRDQYERCVPGSSGTTPPPSGGCANIGRQFGRPINAADLRIMRSPDDGAPYCTFTHRVPFREGGSQILTFHLYRLPTQIETLDGTIYHGTDIQRIVHETYGVPFDVDFSR